MTKSADPVDAFFFDAPRHSIFVEGTEIWVYEYESVDARAAISDTIRMEGLSINHTPVEWIGSPHYWLEDRLIVQYIGDDAVIIETVSEVLGEQFRPPQ